MPGVRSEELEIGLEGQELTIAVERSATKEEDATYYRRERCVGSFSRKIELPVAVEHHANRQAGAVFGFA